MSMYRFKEPVLLVAATVVFAAAGGWGYQGSLRAGFMSEDYLILSRLAAEPVATVIRGGLWTQPLTALTFWVQLKLWGWDPQPYHLLNLILHALVSAVAWRMGTASLRLCAPSASPQLRSCASLLAAVWFLMLPCHTEAVAWVAGRGHVLAALWGAAAFWAYLAYRESGSTRAYFSCALFYTLLLLTQDTAVIFPVLLWVHDRFVQRTGLSQKGESLPKGILGLTVAALLIQTLAAGPHIHDRTVLPILRSDLHGALSGLTLWPIKTLVAHADLEDLRRSERVLAGISIVTLVWMACLRGARSTRSSILACATLAFVAYLLMAHPGSRPSSPEGERYLYFPSMFALLGLALCVCTLVTAQVVRIAVGAILLIYYTARLIAADADWVTAGRSARDTLEAAVSGDPGTSVVLLNVPDNYKGRPVFRSGLIEAIRMRIDVPDGRIWEIAGRVGGRPDEGVEVFPELAGIYRVNLPSAGSSMFVGRDIPVQRRLSRTLADRPHVMRVQVGPADGPVTVCAFAEGRMTRCGTHPGRSGGAG